MSGHDKGPWTTRKYQDGCFDYNEVVAPEGIIVAKCGVGEMAEANARLIAVAPDLLEACEKVSRMYATDCRSPYIVEMRAAIARAKGEANER